MAKTKNRGEIRAEALYDSLDDVDKLLTEAADILRKPKPSAEDMKKVEQLKNLARTKIGNNNTRRDILVSWDKIVAGFNSMAGVVIKKFGKAA